MENTHINTIPHIKHLNGHDHLVQDNDLYIYFHFLIVLLISNVTHISIVFSAV